MIDDYEMLAQQICDEPDASIYDATQSLFEKITKMKDDRHQVLGWLDNEHQVFFVLFAEHWNGST